MAEFPALPLWTDAWVADTHHLSIFARGLYHDLLVLMWRTPGCRVPNDKKWLMLRLRINDAEYDGVLISLIKDLCQSNAEWHMQKRLTREFEYVRAHREKMRAAANKRWEKEKDICQSNAPTPIPIPLSKNPSLRSGARNVSHETSRGSRWAPDRLVSQEWLLLAKCERTAHGLAEINLELEAAKFQNYWAGVAGARATKVDWRKTWLNWILKQEGSKDGQRKPTANDKFLAGVAAFIGGCEPAETGDSIEVDGARKPLLPP